MALYNILTKVVPKPIRQFIKHCFGGNIYYSNFLTTLFAKQWAEKDKRIDVCASQFAFLFHLANISSISGKICLEIGSGWVLSHTIVCYLLGAKKVIATDYYPLARPRVLKYAIKKSTVSLIRDCLAHFDDHQRVRNRLDNILSIKKFDFNILSELGIEYRAPIDILYTYDIKDVDFIYSLSVFEHIPTNQVSQMIFQLKEMLSPGGIMLHAIHLEDHHPSQNNPFAFLSESENYDINQQLSRGNRLRKSTWQKLFNQYPDMKSQLIYEWARTDKNIVLPTAIDRSIEYFDEQDLRVTHIGVLSTKIN